MMLAATMFVKERQEFWRLAIFKGFGSDLTLKQRTGNPRVQRLPSWLAVPLNMTSAGGDVKNIPTG